MSFKICQGEICSIIPVIPEHEPCITAEVNITTLKIRDAKAPRSGTLHEGNKKFHFLEHSYFGFSDLAAQFVLK